MFMCQSICLYSPIITCIPNKTTLSELFFVTMKQSWKQNYVALTQHCTENNSPPDYIKATEASFLHSRRCAWIHLIFLSLGSPEYHSCNSSTDWKRELLQGLAGEAGVCQFCRKPRAVQSCGAAVLAGRWEQHYSHYPQVPALPKLLTLPPQAICPPAMNLYPSTSVPSWAVRAQLGKVHYCSRIK